MSADNWVQCPKCKQENAKASKSHEEKMTEVAEQFASGKISPQEFRAKLAEFDEPTPREEFAIYEENYINPDTNVLEVSYGGECRDCGFTIDYHYSYYFPGIDR